MADVYFDPVSRKAIDAKVPPGKFRVIGVDTSDRHSEGIFYGDFGTIDEAVKKANEITKGKRMFVAYVWDDQGRLVKQTGDF